MISASRSRFSPLASRPSPPSPLVLPMIPSPAAVATVALYGLRAFFVLLLTALAASSNPSPRSLFLATNGRSHRLAGAAHLGWLLLGAFWFVRDGADDATRAMRCLSYDVILGALGIIATLTAARDFPHRRVVNRKGESGTLSHAAMVTQDEMIEHSFYQAMNLWQALYLHTITWVGGDDGAMATIRQSMIGRVTLLWSVTAPWGLRHLFPVHSFSANWSSGNRNGRIRKSNTNEGQRIRLGTQINGDGMATINRMYRVKKWQYIFYKHVILHGLNVSVAFPGYSYNYNNGDCAFLPLTIQWRVFWLALNTSYVMEFFLQSMVKRGILYQQRMMMMNGMLMASSSLSAVVVISGKVRLDAAFLSLVLNFANRHHDTFNTLMTGFVCATLRPSLPIA